MHAIVKNYVELKTVESDPIIIVGTGPVGIRMADELLKKDPVLNIVMYGNEPWEPYNRVGLTSFLAGDVCFDDIKNPVKAKEITHLVQHHNCAIVRIDRVNKKVTDTLGNQQSYSSLVLAIGSSAHIPNIIGVNLKHVYTLRDLKDVDHLFARRMRSRRTIVIGGGLLGLEAARAMQKYNTEVVIVEHGDRLMSRQLDEDLSMKLRENIIALGIKVRLRTGVSKIVGNTAGNNIITNGVTGVELTNGKLIDCDTVILATGIVPNKKLAQDAGLVAARGIRVNDSLKTSDENIYAIGECCEHRGEIFGLVAPGFEQAAITAQLILGNTAAYHGSTNASKLKVFGLEVYSAGEAGDDADSISNQIISYESHDTNVMHRLVIRHRRLVGAMGIGEWAEFERIKEAIKSKRRVWPWQLSEFKRTGAIWTHKVDMQVSSWPANALVCNCKGVSRGELTACVNSGAKTLACIQEKTGASTVCGSCQPLVTSLLGENTQLSAQIGATLLASLSVITAIVIAVYSFSSPISPVDSVQKFQFDALWTDFIYRQISGYSLAGVTFFGVLLLMIRKRFNVKKMGNMSCWRITHVSLSLGALIILIFHTGLNVGSNLNFLLFLFFIMVSGVGVLSSLINAYEHKILPYRVKQWRTYINRVHILTSWPLPVLLGFHITSAYYF